MSLLQPVSNTSFQLEARFLDLPDPDERFQGHGFLAVEDDDNWVRLDIFSRGRADRLVAYGGVTVDGVTIEQFNLVRLPSVEHASFLRMTRSGDRWTLESSADGSAWTTAGSFTARLNVKEAGVFAGSVSVPVSESPGYATRVDYVMNTAAPIPNEDGGGASTPSNRAPVAVDDAAETSAGAAVNVSVLRNDSDPDGDALSVSGRTNGANGTTQILESGAVRYTPNPGFAGTDSFRYTVSDGRESDTATVTVTVAPASGGGGGETGGGAGAFVSDGFDGAGLADYWTVSTPNGGSVQTSARNGDGFAILTAPAGVNASASDDLGSVTLLQAVEDADFQLEAGFLSSPTPTARFQGHGFVAVEDVDTWVQFEVYSRGQSGRLYGYGAVTVDGAQSIEFVTVRLPSVDHAAFLRVTRSGDDWTFETSADGAAWSAVGALTADIEVSETGVYASARASSSVNAPGYTARVDYVQNTAAPGDGDGESGGGGTGGDNGSGGGSSPSNGAPVAVDDVGATEQNTALSIDARANDSDPDGDALTVVSVGDASNGATRLGGDGQIIYQPNAGFVGDDLFDYVVSDGAATDTGSVRVSVRAPQQGSPSQELVAFEDFETDSSNWLSSRYDSSDGLSRFLGRFGGKDQAFGSYDLPEGVDRAIVEFDFYEIDDWDRDKFSFIADGDRVNLYFDADGESEAAQGGQVGDLTWSVTPISGNGQDLGFGDAPDGGADEIHRVRLVVEDPGAELSLRFRGNLNDPRDDEAWGVDNLSIIADWDTV